MQKVQSYIKNLGKSVKYASVDVLKDMSPNTAELISTNSELFKEITYAVRERRTLFNRATNIFRQSKVYEAADTLKSSIFEDIATGNLYNKERKDRINAKVMGMDDMMGDIDLGDFDTGDFGGFDEATDITVSDKFVANSVEASGKASAQMISSTIAKTSEYIVESQRSMNEFNAMQNLQNFRNITNIAQTINDNISQIITFNDQAHKVHIENSKKYYEESTNLLRENNAMFKEFLEMDRNRYKSQQQEPSSNNKRVTYDDIISASGTPDLKAYMQNVTNNINNKLGSIAGMNNMMGEDSNLLLTFVSSPLEFIPKWFVANMINKNLKESAGRLDKSLSGFFSALVTRFNTMAKDDDNMLAKAIGEIFGVRNTLDTKIDTSKYNKGPVPWDGKARQALIEVIPTYLSKLVSLQSGLSEKLYDFEKGRFIEVKDVKADYERTIQSSINSSTDDVRTVMEDTLKNTFAFKDLETSNKLKEDMDKFFKYFFNSGELFDYNRKKFDDYDQIGLSSEDNYNVIRDLFKSLPKHLQTQFYKDIMGGRDSLTKSVKQLEVEGDSIYRYISNNAGINEFFDEKGKFRSDRLQGINSGGNLLETKDALGNNVFFYLHKMTSTLLEGIKVHVMNNGTSPAMAGGGGLILPPGMSGSNKGYDIFNISTDLDNKKEKSEFQIEQEARYREEDRFSENEKRRAENGNLRYLEDVIGKDDVTLSAIIETKRDIDKIQQSLEPQKQKGMFHEFIEDMLEAPTLIEKFNKTRDMTKKVFDAPSNAIAGLLDRVDLRLYEVIYGKEDREYKGTKIKGFLDMIMVDLSRTFEKFNTWLDEKVLTPLAERVGGMGGRIMDGILMGLGINMTSGEIKSKISKFLFGEKDDDGDYISSGLVSNFTDQVKSDLKGIKEYIFGKNSTFRKIYQLVKRHAYDQTKHNNIDRYDLLLEIQKELVRFSSSDAEEKKIAKSIRSLLDKSSGENLEGSITEITNILRLNGYADDDTSVMSILKDSFKTAKDYVVGENTTLDQINKFLNVPDYKDLIDKSNTNTASMINPNKFIALVNLLGEYLVVVNDDKKLAMLSDIKLLITNIDPQNDKERVLKSSLLLIYSSSFTNVSKEKDYDKIGLSLLKEIKSKVTGLTEINRILTIYERKIKDVERRENEKELEQKQGSTITQNLSQKTGVNFTTSPVSVPKFEAINELKSVFNMESTPNKTKESIDDFINGLDIKPDGSHNEGLNKVPFDGYHAVLHKGEKVLTKEEAERYDEMFKVMDMKNPNAYLQTGTTRDASVNIVNKLQDMLSKYNPDNEEDAGSKKRITDIINSFDGYNIEEVLSKVKQETDKNRKVRGVDTKTTLAENVITEFKNMFTTTKSILFGEEPLENTKFKINDKLKEATKDILGNIKDYAPKMGSGALIGAGVGLLPGLLGGPVLWGGVGAATALIKNSSKVQEYLFGQEVDGKRQGGLVPKQILDGISKFSPDLKKYGVTGAALGLMPFTPVGIVGGLTIGAATAFAKNNTTAQEMLFGEKGLVGKEGKQKIEKFLPKAVVGTILTGIGGKMLTGSLFGPFGLVGGTLIGSALGMASTTDKFKDLILGEKGKDGKRKGGAISFIRETFLDMSYFVKENMLKPLIDSLAPLRKEAGLIVKKVVDGIIGVVDRIFESTFGAKLSKMLKDFIFKPITKLVGGLGKGLHFLGTEALAMPGKLVQYGAESLRLKHIRDGHGDYMSTDERQELLEKDIAGNRFANTMLARAKRRKHLKETQNEAVEQVLGDNKPVVEAIESNSEKTNEKIEQTNTTLKDILGEVSRLGQHLTDKVTKSISMNNETDGDEASILTPQGEVKFKRDYKGVLNPVPGEAYKKIQDEIHHDNTWQERLLSNISNLKGEEKEEGKDKGILSTISSFIPGFLKLIPAVLVALPFIPTIASGLQKVLGFLGKNGLGQSGDSSQGEIEGGGLFEGGVETMKQTFEDRKRIMLNVGMFGNNILSKGFRLATSPLTNKVDKVLSKSFNVGKNFIGSNVSKIPGVAKLTDNVADLASRGFSLFEKAFNIFKSPQIQKVIGTEIAEAIVRFPSKIKNLVSPQVLGKIGTKLGSFMGPLAIALMVGDIIWGMDNADEILQMAGEIPFTIRVISGLVNAINQRLAFGLIPKKFILTTVVKLVPGNSLDESVAEGQEEMKKMYEEYSRNADGNIVNFDEYSKNAKKYNKEAGVKDSSNFRWWNPTTWGSNTKTNSDTTRFDRPSYGMGTEVPAGMNALNFSQFPFLSQKDSQWSNVQFNTKNDKGKQTIGDSGCGPVSAAMVATALTGKDVNPTEAANFALENNFKEPNGGTHPEFFKQFLQKHGINSNINELQGQYKGQTIQGLISNLKNNIPVILMGKSAGSKNVPFGSNPHYVVATGIDSSNNILINDPEKSSGNERYSLMDTLMNSTIGISSTIDKRGFTPTKSATDNAMMGEESFLASIFESNKGLGPIGELLSASEVMVKKLLGIPLQGNESSGMDMDYSDGNTASGVPLSKNAFIQKVIPGAMKNYKRYGVLPSITVAQAILESAWGKKSIGNNLFGIKAGKFWFGKTQRVLTHEFENGIKVPKYQVFRDYNSVDESIQDHGSLLAGSRYAKVRASKNYVEAAHALYQAGYATDPEYAQKIISTIRSNGLDNLDNGNYNSSTAYNLTTNFSNSKGNVTGKTDMHSWVLDRLGKLSEDHGNKQVSVTSGYRSREKQQQIWNEHKRKYPFMPDALRRKWVADPSGIGSTHMMGVAADISTPWVKSLNKDTLAKYGLWRPLGNEPWHFEAIETGYPDPKKRQELYSSLPAKFGTPENPKFRPSGFAPSTKNTLPKISPSNLDKIMYGTGNSDHKFIDNMFAQKENIKIPQIDRQKYMYGTGITSNKATSRPTGMNAGYPTQTTSTQLTNKPNELPTTKSSGTGSKLLAVLIELLTKIVDNTNNLSEVVRILSEGLNINIPEKVLKGERKDMSGNLAALLATSSRGGSSEDGEIINLIHMLESIATQ